MLTVFPSSTYFGFPDPLLDQTNLHRVHEQIITNDFERVHDRGIENIEEDSGSSALKSSIDTDENERSGIYERKKITEFLHNRLRNFHFEVAMLEGEGNIKEKMNAVASRRSFLFAHAAYRTGVQYKVIEENAVDLSI